MYLMVCSHQESVTGRNLPILLIIIRHVTNVVVHIILHDFISICVDERIVVLASCID